MNKKGFTLVELIATIALLAIIAIISFVSINAILNDSKVRNCESLVYNITSAAKEYVSDNRYVFDDWENFQVEEAFSIDTNNLINGGYLSGHMYDPFSDEELSPEKVMINIKLDEKDYSAESIEIKVNNVVVNCGDKKTFEYAFLGSGSTSEEDVNTNSGSSGSESSGNADDSSEDNTGTTGDDSLGTVVGGSTGNIGGSTGGVVGGIIGGSSSSTGIELIDKSGDSCPQGIEYFYTEGQYRYYFTCQKSGYMYVSVNGVEYGLVYALENKIVTIAQIESSTGYTFLKQTLNVQTS